MIELVRLVRDSLHGWRWRVGGLVSIDVGRWTAGVFVGNLGNLGLLGVGVLATAEGFPDAGGVEFGIFDLLEGLGDVSGSLVWSGLVWFSKMHSKLPLGQGRQKLCKLREEPRRLTGCRRFG